MDEVVRFGPWILSAAALLLAWGASASASRARARTATLEQVLVTRHPPEPAPVPPEPAPVVASSVPTTPADAPVRSTAFEVRLGALEERIAKLSDRVAFAARPDPEDVAPMRPPVPTTVESVAAPRAGWRMFP